MSTTDEFVLDSLSDQVREVLKTSPGLTSKGVGQLVPTDARSKISRVLYDLKSTGQVQAVKGAEDGLLHYSLAEGGRGEGNGISSNGLRHYRKPTQGALDRPMQVLMTVISQRIEDTPTLDLIWAWGDLRAEAVKGNGQGKSW